MNKLIVLSLSMMIFVGSGVALAEENVKEKVGEAASDTKKSIKKSYRNASDKACEMVNGKMECLGKKAKHKMENLKDEVNDKADDVKKKVN